MGGQESWQGQVWLKQLPSLYVTWPIPRPQWCARKTFFTCFIPFSQRNITLIYDTKSTRALRNYSTNLLESNCEYFGWGNSFGEDFVTYWSTLSSLLSSFLSSRCSFGLAKFWEMWWQFDFVYSQVINMLSAAQENSPMSVVQALDRVLVSSPYWLYTYLLMLALI